MRHRGGGHKRMYRRIDFKRDKFGIPARVAEIEYDPNRTARIALLVYADGEKRYILHPKGLKQGDTVVSGPGSDARIGNALPLSEMPLGTTVHNIELKIGKGGQMARSAGHGAQVVAKEGDYVTLRMRSTEMRLVHGALPGDDRRGGQLGARAALASARPARRRWLGKRPKVRGVAMNPVDHPLGGGEGKTSGGRPAGEPVGQAGGREDPQPEEGVEPVHRARPQAREGDASNVARASRRVRSSRTHC